MFAEHAATKENDNALRKSECWEGVFGAHQVVKKTSVEGLIT